VHAAGAAADAPAYEVLARMKGAELRGKNYEPMFKYFVDGYKDTAWRVVTDTYVTDDSGTGVVHQAPAFGEDDYRVCSEHGIVAKGAEVPCPVDSAGRFTAAVSDFEGMHVKDADKGIIAAIKQTGRLVDLTSIVHSYPFCWRSDTPLIYKVQMLSLFMVPYQFSSIWRCGPWPRLKWYLPIFHASWVWGWILPM
jgi:isoleucyl-tRNA synthetase